jgi:pSer/pThr/pTyr-binding forkhead associated (FHA) protein
LNKRYFFLQAGVYVSEKKQTMARLLIKTEGLEQRALVLRLGVNHVGRDPDCEICIDHPTISSRHCELALTDDGVYLRDCESTNGTFINDEPVTETWLDPGQQLRLGDVELFVESTDANIAIPQFEPPRQQPLAPVVLPDGALACPRHARVMATYKCTHCSEVMCSACIHVMRRKGGAPLFLCAVCSHKCERIQAVESKKKKGMFGLLMDTVRLKFKHTISRTNVDK